MLRSRSLSVVLCLSLLPGISAVAQNCDGWIPIGPPPPRSTPFFAYDSNASRALMFGGTNRSFADPGDFHEDVWFIQDGQWRYVADSSDLTKAALGGMAFDAQRNVFVIVREANGNWQLGGTWEFDGATWVQRAPLAQTPTGVKLVYDPLAQNVVAYGSNFVQRWDGTSWQTDAVMQAGIGSASPMLAWDGAAGGFVSISSDLNSQSGPTRLYRNQTWSQIAPTSPRGYCDMTFDPTRGTMVAMRTDSVLPFPDTSLFELREGAWRTVPNSSLNDRSFRRLYFDVRSQSLMVVGSRVFSSMGLSPTIHRFGPSGWVPLDDPVGPEHSINPMMAYDTDRRRMIFAGGGSMLGSAIDRSTWELRGDTWRRRGDVPRLFGGDAGYNGFDAGATYDPVRRRIVGTLNFGNSVEFDGTAWISRGSSSSAGSRRLPRWDGSRQRVVGGGLDGFALYNPSGTNVWSPFSIQGVTSSLGAIQQLAVDASANRVLALTQSQTLLIVGNTLTDLLASPVDRPGPIAFDPVRGGFVLFSGSIALGQGGGSINLPAKTYFLPQAGGTWQELPVRGPIGRVGAELVWDSDAQRLVLSAGSLDLGTFPAYGFWKLAQGPAGIAVPPVAATVNARESAELFTIAKGGGVLNYTWRRNGQVITDSPNIRGATTDTLLLRGATLADAGEYTVTVTNPCGTETSQPVTLTVNSILCDSIDFNRNEVFPEEQDVIDFFLVLAGGECPYTPPSGEACDVDFNNNQVFPEEQDVIDFFNVLAGESC